MAFATLQEAWGVNTFQQAKAVSGSPVRRPHVPIRALDSPAAAAVAPVQAPVRVPAGRSPTHTLHRYLEDVYAKRGAKGVARVLGRRMVKELCGLRGGGGGGGFGNFNLEWLGDTETVLFVLIGAFVFLVMVDSMRSA